VIVGCKNSDIPAELRRELGGVNVSCKTVDDGEHGQLSELLNTIHATSKTILVYQTSPDFDILSLIHHCDILAPLVLPERVQLHSEDKRKLIAPTALRLLIFLFEWRAPPGSSLGNALRAGVAYTKLQGYEMVFNLIGDRNSPIPLAEAKANPSAKAELLNQIVGGPPFSDQEILTMIAEIERGETG
jgi:hypothetical protein